MNRKTLKNHLQSLRELNQVRATYAALRAEAEGPKSPAMTGMPHGSEVGSQVEDIAVRLVDLERRYLALIDRALAEVCAIEDALADLDPPERLLIRARYIDGRRWEDVCAIVGYGWAQTHRLHAAVLRKLEEAECGGNC